MLQHGEELYEALWPLLSAAEIEALGRRAQRLLASRIFPSEPRNRRAFPYPPI
jgi:hypothetical protein